MLTCLQLGPSCCQTGTILAQMERLKNRRSPFNLATLNPSFLQTALWNITTVLLNLRANRDRSSLRPLLYINQQDLSVVSGGGRKQAATMVKGRTGQRVRLYARGTILGYKR